MTDHIGSSAANQHARNRRENVSPSKRTSHDLSAVEVPHIDWSDYSTDPLMQRELGLALRKLVLCGTNADEAVQVLGELAMDCRRSPALSRTATDFGCLNTPTLQVKAGVSLADLASGIHCHLANAVRVINENAEFLNTIEAQAAMGCAQLALEVAEGLALALVTVLDKEVAPNGH